VNPSEVALAIANKHATGIGERLFLATDIEAALLNYAQFIAWPRWGKCSYCRISHDWPNGEGGDQELCVREGAQKPTPIPKEKS